MLTFQEREDLQYFKRAHEWFKNTDLLAFDANKLVSFSTGVACEKMLLTLVSYYWSANPKKS